MLAVSTGDFRRFERFAMVLVGASLLLIPIYFMVTRHSHRSHATLSFRECRRAAS